MDGTLLARNMGDGFGSVLAWLGEKTSVLILKVLKFGTECLDSLICE